MKECAIHYNEILLRKGSKICIIFEQMLKKNNLQTET